MVLIVCVDEKSNWGIGYNNQLLYHIREDLHMFKKKTTGNVVVMGRKTYLSLPVRIVTEGENSYTTCALPNRENYVFTRSEHLPNNDDVNDKSIKLIHYDDHLPVELLEYEKDVYVIGGSEIYDLLLPYCDTAYITRVIRKNGYELDNEPDTFLHNLLTDPDWKLTDTTLICSNDNYEAYYQTFERVNKHTFDY